MLSSLTTQTSVQAHTFRPYGDSWPVNGFSDEQLSPIKLPSLSKLVGRLAGNRGRKALNNTQLAKPLA